MTACLFVLCFLSTILPFTADYIYLLASVRLLMGANAAVVFPSVYSIIINWVPLNQRSFCFSLFGVAISSAKIVGLLTTGDIFETYGWPGLFFMSGIVSGIIGIITLIFLRKTPKADKELVTLKTTPKHDSQEEIVDEDDEVNETLGLSTPFLSIFRNNAFLSYIFFHFNQQFTAYIQGSKMPVYFTKVLHEDLGRFGTWSAIMCGIGGLSSMLGGYIADKLINKKCLSRTNTRKLGCSFAVGTYMFSRLIY